MRNYVTDPRILEVYVAETLSLLASPRKRQRKTLNEKWSVVDDYFHRRHLMSESKILLAEGYFKKVLAGLTNMASYVGGKFIDAGSWVAQNAKNMAKGVANVMKKIAGKLQDIVVYCIKALPGGEIILEFLSEVASKLKEKIAEMRAAIGKKVEDFVNGAKRKIIDFFFKYILKDREMKKDFYHAMGVKESDLEELRTESKKIGLNTVNELNLYLDTQHTMRKILNEEEESSGLDSIADQIKKKTGMQDAEDAAKVLGFIENKGADGKQSVNPEEFMRGKASAVVEKLIEFWLKLVERNPKKYHKPFFESGFFKPFGTGFGLASATMLGILGSSKLEWNDLVRFVEQMIRGFKGGTGRPPGAQTDLAGAYLFLGNKYNNFDASLFKSFIKGVIEGSNIEVIIRALTGDPSKIGELCKRLLGTIVNAVKTKINDNAPQAIQSATGETVSDEHEDGVNEQIGKYVDDMYSV